MDPFTQVTFVGEGAVDTGGPRREFLRLLAAELTSSPHFQSGSEGSFFACNTTGYKVGCYIHIHCLVMSFSI